MGAYGAQCKKMHILIHSKKLSNELEAEFRVVPYLSLTFSFNASINLEFNSFTTKRSKTHLGLSYKALKTALLPKILNVRKRILA